VVSLTSHVRIDHPAVKEFWANRHREPDPVAAALDYVARFDYVARPGVVSMDRVLEEQVGNCLALSILLCTLIRGFPRRDIPAFVATGAVRGFAHESIHAWTFVPLGGGRVRVIDPAGWRCSTSLVDEIVKTYRIFAAFNETLCEFDDDWTKIADLSQNAGVSRNG